MLRAVLLAISMVLTSAGPSPAASTGSPGLARVLAPPSHIDKVDATGPLDLRRVTFGQAGTELVWSVRTTGVWGAGQVRDPRALCVVVYATRGQPATGRLCVRPAAVGLAVSFFHLDADGNVTERDRLKAPVTRADPRSFSVDVPPASLGLAPGAYAWQVVAGADSFPDDGPSLSHIGLFNAPRCFGAAARAAGGCSNPALRSVAVPTPREAFGTLSGFCAPLANVVPNVCRFRAPPPGGDAETFALLGDSHAGAWRGALSVVATARGWIGVSSTAAGCPFTAARAIIADKPSTACDRHNNQVLTFLRSRPGIHTIFVSAHNGAVEVAKGHSERVAQISGFVRQWRRLPPSIQHIIVLRDTPKTGRGTPICVTQALAAHRRMDTACASPRSTSVRPDAEAVAVAASRDPRARLIDMTSFFCGATFCPPVIGGVLVRKDTEHLTDTFSESLGPFLLRRLSFL